MALSIIRPDVDGFDADNRTALAAASGRVDLPRGTVAVDVAPVIKGSVQLVGSGTTLASRTANENALRIQGDHDNYDRALTPGPIGPDAVGWTWEPGGGFDHDERSKCTRFVGTPPAQHVGNAMKVAKRATIIADAKAGATTVTATRPDLVPVGALVLVADGPYDNEFSGEWAYVIAKAGAVLTLSRSLPRPFKQAAVMVGTWPRVKLSGLTLAGDVGPLAVFGAPGTRVDHCTLLRNANFGGTAGWFNLTTSSDVLIAFSRIDCGIMANTSSRLRLLECSLPFVGMEEDCRDWTIERCVIGPSECERGTLDSVNGCSGVTVRDTLLYGNVNVYAAWNLERVTHAGGNFFVRGSNSTLKDFTSDSQVVIQEGYAAKNVTLDNVQCAGIYLGKGTSGRIVRKASLVTWQDEATRMAWGQK